MTDFEDLASAAMPGLLRFGYVLTGDPLRAEKFVQQPWSAPGRAGRAGRASSTTSRTPTSVAAMVHTWTSWWRRSRRESLLSDGRDVAAPVAADLGVRERTLTAMQHLPPRQRTAVVLRSYEDLSEAEVIVLSRGGMQTTWVSTAGSRSSSSRPGHSQPRAAEG